MGEISARADCVARAALRLLGVPYAAGGRTLRGLDCVGLVAISFCEGAGIRIPIPVSTPTDPLVVRRELRARTRPIEDDLRRPGDVVLIASRSAGTHLGILTDRGVVHADNAAGCVVLGLAFGDRACGYYRVRGIA